MSSKPVYTLDQIINQLDSDYQWHKTQLNYAFATITPSGGYPGGESTGLSTLNTEQQHAAQIAIQLWQDLINIDFVETLQGSADILFTNYTDAGQAYAYFPPYGDIFINPNQSSNLQLDFGDYGFLTLIHEFGHSLGLDHPGDYSASSNNNLNYENQAEYYQDSLKYSVMSYWDAFNTGAYHSSYFPSTPMLHDIAAIQSIYGANLNTRTDDTVYGFNTTTNRTVFDFSSNHYPQSTPILTIWDAGGTDTLDLSGYSNSAYIDLNDGSYSDAGGLTYNIAIAFNTYIENTVGGSGNDTIIGQELDNRLNGGAGNDIFTGSSGNDILIGGDGYDTAVFSGSLTDYAIISLGDDNYQIIGLDGTDILQGIESLRFDNNILHTLDNSIASSSIIEISSYTEGEIVLVAYDGQYQDDIVTYDENSQTVTISGVSGQGVFNDLDRIIFTDGTLAVNRQDSAFDIYRLYEAAFNRTPDLGGLSHWINYISTGATLNVIAEEFERSEEFVNTYGSNLSEQEFVNILYNNVLDRDGEPAGISYWLEQLANGMNTHEVLIGFSNSNENINNTEAYIDDGVWFVS